MKSKDNVNRALYTLEGMKSKDNVNYAVYTVKRMKSKDNVNHAVYTVKGPRKAVLGCIGTLKIDPIMKVLCVT